MKVALSKIKPSPDNAAGRSEMNVAMEELIATIKAVGVCEGISVRPNGNGYEVIGGERRLFAAKEAGLKEVDVIVHEVPSNEARLMRLASLTHEDWEYEAFAEKIWQELADRPTWTAHKLHKETGISKQKVERGLAFHAGKMEGAVVEIDEEVAVYQTYTLHQRLSDKNGGTKELRQAVAEKMSNEKVEAKPSEKLCARVKKALPAIVEFGIRPEPEKGIKGDKDYEENNFELDAVLRITWGADNYEGQVKAMAEALHGDCLKDWEAARFGNTQLKAFTKGANEWKKELRKVLKFKKAFTWEHAQFTLNLLEGVDELAQELITELETVMEEEDNG